jgi:ATP-dependent 26S proteasome regulatory subunit
MFYGPPGNGKTISIKALMHGLLDRKHPIPTLYVKSAPNEYSIKNVFAQARRLAPCMLVLEDVETIVTPQTRSYFFNQMDGLEDNSGLFVVASTNYLDRLDPGLTSRPSRFDRKYLFPLPSEHERTLYCEFWRRKVAHKGEIKFPQKLCPAMAKITHGFSFAFLQECFVATLLSLIHRDATVKGPDDELEKYELWVAFKKQADILRKEIRNEEPHSLGSVELPTSGVAGSTASTSAPALSWQSLEDGQQLESVTHAMKNHRMEQHGTAVLPTRKGSFVNTAAFEYR